MLDTLPVSNSRPTRDHYDVIIVGSGMGGGTFAYALKDAGDKRAVASSAVGSSLRSPKLGCRTQFSPGTLQECRGLVRRRRQALQPRYLLLRRRQHQVLRIVAGSVSPRRLPFHRASGRRIARLAVRLRGTRPALPPRRAGLQSARRTRRPDPAAKRAVPVPRYRLTNHPSKPPPNKLRKLGKTPSTIPLGIDLRQGGSCIRCATCDGFPCRTLAKSDADVCCVRPAVASGAVELVTQGRVDRVLTDPTGRHAVGVECVIDGTVHHHRGGRQSSSSCGAVNSAALLLRSANDHHPRVSRTPLTRSAATTWSTTTRSWSGSTPSAETPRSSRRRSTSTTTTCTARPITPIPSATYN